jgi:uncharacterized repeat protein (TIGR02543 family)
MFKIPNLKKITFCLTMFFCVNFFSQSITINEIVSSNIALNFDEDGDYNDWIEIYNYGTTIINLEEFGLSDQTDDPYKWIFPSVELAPNQYLLVWASDKNRASINSQLHSNFKIKSGGEAIVLTNSAGTKLSESPAVAIVADNSYGKNPDGTGSWAFFQVPTPGASNTGSSSAGEEKIAINEFMSLNSNTIADEDGDFEDWIEIYNYGTSAVNLLSFGLSDDKDLPYKWVFPSVSLAPNEYLLVWASGKDKSINNNQLHTNFKLETSGETLFLTNTKGVLVSGSPSATLITDVSYGRQPNGIGSWLFFDNPTPKSANSNDGNTTSLIPPKFSHDSGFYNTEFNLELSSEIQNATIIYTLDGSEPDVNNTSGTSFNYKNVYPDDIGDDFGPILNETFLSNVYNSSILIKDRSNDPDKLANKNTMQDDIYIPPSPVRKITTIKAKVYVNGKGSETKSKNYLLWSGVNPYKIPVVSIQTNEKHLFDYVDGVYNAGVNFDNWRKDNLENKQSWRPENNNYWRRGREWEYPADIEIFDANSLTSIQNIKGGFRVHGNNSRGRILKAIKLYARSEYDKEVKFEHKLLTQTIPGSVPNNNYKRILLRGDGSGGDVAYDVVFNKMMQPFFNGITRIRNVAHFINGEYWGLTAIRDRFDKYHFAYNFDLDPENVIIVACDKSRCEVDEGEEDDIFSYRSMRDYIMNNNMSIGANYIEAQKLLDVDSFINHILLEIFIENNSYERFYWKVREPENDNVGDGKWRLIIRDFEATLFDDKNWLEIYAEISDKLDDSLFGKLLENEEFKNKFINRLSDLMNSGFKSERFNSIVENTFEEVSPYLEEDINRSYERDDLFYKPSSKRKLLEWIDGRHTAMRNQIKDFFKISSTIDLELDVSYYNAGYVKVNTIDIRSTTPGISEESYPWLGTYYKEIPITVEAKEYPGFTFSKWSGSSTSADKKITITPTGNLQLKANYTRNEDYNHTIYFWLFDDALENDTPLQNIKATYSRNNVDAFLKFTSSLSGYPFTASNEFWRKASLERINQPTSINYIPFANNDVIFDSNIVKGLQIKQPFKSSSLENSLELSFSTVNFKEIQLSFAVKSNGAAQTLIVDYWNGTSWVATNLNSTFSLTSSYEKKEINFSNIELANNNPDFKVRIRFDGTNMTEQDDKIVAFNNISLDGKETTLSTETLVLLNDIKIYPNPTKDIVTISARKTVKEVVIYNLLGQLILKQSINNTRAEINLQGFDKGIYFLKIISEYGFVTKKIIHN